MTNIINSGSALAALEDVVRSRPDLIGEAIAAIAEIDPITPHHFVLVVSADGVRVERRVELVASYRAAGVYRLVNALLEGPQAGHVTVLIDSEKGVVMGRTTLDKLTRLPLCRREIKALN